MGPQAYSALCSACRVPLVPVADHDPQDWFACPCCRVGDTRENILREVGKHAEEIALRHFQKAARNVSRKVEWVEFTCKAIPKRSYRFVSDFEL